MRAAPPRINTSTCAKNRPAARHKRRKDAAAWTGLGQFLEDTNLAVKMPRSRSSSSNIPHRLCCFQSLPSHAEIFWHSGERSRSRSRSRERRIERDRKLYLVMIFKIHLLNEFDRQPRQRRSKRFRWQGTGRFQRC